MANRLQYLTVFTIVKYEMVKNNHFRFSYSEKREVPAQTANTLAQELLSTNPGEDVLGWAVRFGNHIKTLPRKGKWMDVASATFTKVSAEVKEESPRGATTNNKKEDTVKKSIRCGKCSTFEDGKDVPRYHASNDEVRRCYEGENIPLVDLSTDIAKEEDKEANPVFSPGFARLLAHLANLIYGTEYAVEGAYVESREMDGKNQYVYGTVWNQSEYLGQVNKTQTWVKFDRNPDDVKYLHVGRLLDEGSGECCARKSSERKKLVPCGNGRGANDFLCGQHEKVYFGRG